LVVEAVVRATVVVLGADVAIGYARRARSAITVAAPSIVGVLLVATLGALLAIALF
jgi:hypothetical protein